jgi:hypothetical protein
MFNGTPSQSTILNRLPVIGISLNLFKLIQGDISLDDRHIRVINRQKAQRLQTAGTTTTANVQRAHLHLSRDVSCIMTQSSSPSSKATTGSPGRRLFSRRAPQQPANRSSSTTAATAAAAVKNDDAKSGESVSQDQRAFSGTVRFLSHWSNATTYFNDHHDSSFTRNTFLDTTITDSTTTTKQHDRYEYYR